MIFIMEPSATLDPPVTATDVGLPHGPSGALCLHIYSIGTRKAVLEVSVAVIIISVAKDPCEAPVGVWGPSGGGNQEDDYQLARESETDHMNTSCSPVKDAPVSQMRAGVIDIDIILT